MIFDYIESQSILFDRFDSVHYSKLFDLFDYFEQYSKMFDCDVNQYFLICLIFLNNHQKCLIVLNPRSIQNMLIILIVLNIHQKTLIV